MKNTPTNRIRILAAWMLLITFLALSIGCSHPTRMGRETSADPSITVIYPKPGQVVTSIDSTFIHGNIGTRPDGLRLTINDQEVSIHEDGGFIAFVPVEPGEFAFNLKVGLTTDGSLKAVDELRLPVTIPKPTATLPENGLTIAGDYRAPRGDLVLATGDRLDISFRGSPGKIAWASIPGAVDSIPMSESSPRSQPYWGESVFGAGAVPDSVRLGGVYNGFYVVPSHVTMTDTTLIYHLAGDDPSALLAEIVANPYAPTVIDLIANLREDPVVSMEAAYRVSLNRPDYPFTVRFTDSVQIVRHGPHLGYLSIFQPEGVEALVVGTEDGWHRLRLSHSTYGWVSTNSVERLAPGQRPPRSLVGSFRTEGTEDALTIEIPLSGRHAYRIIEEDRKTIKLQLFGVTSNTDWIRYDFSDSLVDIATWSQPEPDLFEIKLELTKKIWGYDTYYIGNTLYLKLNKPPANVGTLKGKRIVVDPGHSSDAGAIGPTGLTEKEANLGIALVLAERLRRKGAVVIMTRSDDSHVALYDRPSIAKANDADLFVSIHNNALPDGANPFENNGVSSYYYHPHSIDLAKAIQREMIDATGLPDHGLLYGNLAVQRPTQYPAVLIECAFMIMPEQEALLKTDKFRQKVAGAVVRGIEQFLRGYDDTR